jgi:DNA repair exonuclease SbcCD nuclease subunit
MKLGLFSDPHYSSAPLTCGVRYNSRSLAKIREAYQFFKEQKCDLVICLGDLTDKEKTPERVRKNLDEIASEMRDSDIPTFCLIGNHDAFALGRDEFYSALSEFAPRNTEIDGKLLLFLDACYFNDGKPYQAGDDDWTDTFYPYAQHLSDALGAAQGDVYLFIHQNIDPAVDRDHRLCNADALFELINASGRVKAVFQGHFHAGRTSEYNGVRYITLPAMCQNDKAYYVFEI